MLKSFDFYRLVISSSFIVPFSFFYKYSRKSGICTGSFPFKRRRSIPDRLSRMSSPIIIHITTTILFKLGIQVHLHTDNRNIFFIGQKLIYSCSGPFRVSRWGLDSFFKEYTNNFPQACSSEIILKYAADNICPFLIDDNFFVNQNIAIRSFIITSLFKLY